MRWCENIRMCLLRKIKNIKSENSAKKFGGIKKSGYLCNAKAETLIEILAKIAQLVEHDLAKVGVAGSSPVFRSKPSPHSLCATSHQRSRNAIMSGWRNW